MTEVPVPLQVLRRNYLNPVRIPSRFRFNGCKLTWTIKSTKSDGSKLTRTGFASSGSARCSGSASITIGGAQLNGLTNIAAQEENGKYAVYPNPVSNRLTITSDMQSMKSSDIAIYDLQGKLYRVNESRQVSAYKVELDLTSLAPGVYMVRLNTGKENKIFRIV